MLAAFRLDHEGTVNFMTQVTRWEGPPPAFLSRRLRGRRVKAHQQERIALVNQHTRCTGPLKVCDASLYVFEYFLEMIRSAAEVHTDRLHCMLLAVMLGKPTFAYSTAYGKLEAVCEHSLKDRAHVQFVGDMRPSPSGARQLSLASAHVPQT